ncbi:MAG: hypothetical protein ACXWAT_11010 [Methylobacter sp.]
MSHTSIAFLSSSGLFFGILIAIEIGRYLGARHLPKDLGSGQAAIGLLDGAVFALLGLLLAFTFNGATSRFDHRKDLVMQEANAIGTAYLPSAGLITERSTAGAEEFVPAISGCEAGHLSQAS